MSRPHQLFHAITDRPERREGLPVSRTGESAAVGRMLQLADSVLQDTTLGGVHVPQEPVVITGDVYARCSCGAVSLPIPISESRRYGQAFVLAAEWLCDEVEGELGIRIEVAKRREAIRTLIERRRARFDRAVAAAGDGMRR